MKKNMIAVAAVVMTITATMAGMTSCSNEDYLDGMGLQQSEAMSQNQGQEPDDPNLLMIREELKTQMLMSAICDVDSVPGSGTATYTPRIGKVLYSATPTVYYTVADTPEEAEAYYYDIVSALQDSTGMASIGHAVMQGDIRLTFTPGGAANETGRLVIDCPRLKDVITTLVYVPKAAWPENISSPIPFMSLVKEKSTGHIFLCLREAFGCQGILLTFDGGWIDDRFESDWQGTFYMKKYCAKQEVFNCLGRAIETRGTAVAEMMQMVCDRIPWDNITRNVLGKLYYERETMDFDCEYSYRKGRWWLATNYYIDLYKAKFENRKYTGYKKHYEHKSRPSLSIPSFAIYFNAQTPVNDLYEFIYKPGSSTKKNRG